MKNMKKYHKGFKRADAAITLVCVAFLFATLGAIGARGREHAKRTLCASQLQKWGRAIIMQSADNGGEIMFMVRRWGGGAGDPGVAYPHYIGAVPDFGLPGVENYMHPGEFSVYEMAPYIDCVSKDFYQTGSASKILACPATDGDFIIEWCTETWLMFCAPDGIRTGPPEYFIEPSYSYWVIGGMRPPLDASDPGTENGDGSANIYRDLTVDVLSPTRLLMSEVMNLDGGSPYFLYNHGRDGWAWNLLWVLPVPTGRLREDGQQDATGRNQLFGDGRVDWRPISLEFEDNIPSEIIERGGVGFLENEWNGPGSGWVNQWDVSWY
jgi:hypothetical protein